MYSEQYDVFSSFFIELDFITGWKQDVQVQQN